MKFAILAPFALLSLCAAEPDGSLVYIQRCAVCHDSKTMERLPPRDELKKRTPESVVDALTKGVMREQGKGMSDGDMQAVAKFLTGKEFAGTQAAAIQGKCEGTAPAITFSDSKDWNGWGRDPVNSRYQPNPGIPSADVPRLKLKWAFGFPGAQLGYSQPTIVGGRVFVGSQGGSVYSLDAKTGCTWWSYKADSWVRPAPVVAKVGNRTVVFIGDDTAITYALDAMTGELIWKEKLDDHPVARVTGAPVFYQNHLYVSMSSVEEVSGPNPKYECCKFRGSVTSLDAATGKKLWKTHTISDPPKEYKKNSTGVAMYGPAGAAIWTSPTIDVKRKVIYVGTGNSYTDIETKGTNAIEAIDIETGSIKWINQITPRDSFLVGCNVPGKGNCPTEGGPDVDFGSSPILVNVAGGKQLLLCGQKSGILYALDPDKRGAVVWQARLGQGSALGGIEWGFAADKDAVYVGVSDIITKTDNPGSVNALKLATGEKIWTVTPEKPACSFQSVKCTGAQSAAISVIPGVVFAGALDGHMRGYSTKDGSIVWDFDTGKSFESVNGVKARGGSIDGAGPTIANGMVFTNSGYGRFTGAWGNVLLAFGVE